MFTNEQLGILNEGHKYPPFLVFIEFCMFFTLPPPILPTPTVLQFSPPLCALSPALPRPICSVQTFPDVWSSPGGLTRAYTFSESSLLSPSTEDLPAAAQLGVEVYAQLPSPCQGFRRLGLAQVLRTLL